MRRRLLAALSSAAAVSLSFVALATSADAAPSDQGLSNRNDHVCAAAPQPGFASCSAIRHSVVDAHGKPVNSEGAKPNATHSGYATTDLRAAYGLTAAHGNGATVAIVDAYDDPYALSDLNTYRSAYGIPTCTSSNPCFKKVNQKGGSALPRPNGGWAQEISLDLDVVSATCPDCNILLVEANSSSFADLSAAVNYAAAQPGVVAVSNSYGGSDNSAYASFYDHPGKAITASTGDSGYGVQAPASNPGVVAVGGTSLKKNSATNVYSETAWSGAGSGCSTLNTSYWQDPNATGCAKKANADVSAVADPNTGVTVYDSYTYQGYRGWMVFGGTSASSPLIASVFAMGGGVPTGTEAGSLIWAKAGNASALHDVVGGSNGSCSVTKWCNAVGGWDGPTGLGTPNGTAAF